MDWHLAVKLSPEGVQAIWSEGDSKWSLIASAGGVVAVTGQDPIEVDIATNGAGAPIVKIKDGSESQKGAVQLAMTRRLQMALLVLPFKPHN